MRIEIALTDEQRVLPQIMSHRVNDTFHSNHPLGTAKATKGSVRLGMGFASMRHHPQIRNVIGIIRMAHGAQGDGLRQVP